MVQISDSVAVPGAVPEETGDAAAEPHRHARPAVETLREEQELLRRRENSRQTRRQTQVRRVGRVACTEKQNTDVK